MMTDTARRTGSLAKEFREFLLKQNVIALAAGVVIGAAIGKVVSGIVELVVMPIVGLLLPGQMEWRALKLDIGGGNLRCQGCRVIVAMHRAT